MRGVPNNADSQLTGAPEQAARSPDGEEVKWLRQFVRLENGIPVDDTFARVLSVLSPKAFAECLFAWTQALSQCYAGEVIAIDGKTARRSHDRKNQRNPLHLVRAWQQAQGIALGMVKTEAKSNEITAIPELLSLLELKGAIVTLDAMGCQTAIAEQIIRQGGDCVLAVKENQPSLHEDLREFFATACTHRFSGVEHSFAEEVDGGHGRIEIRRCWATECLQTLRAPNRWFGLKSIALIERERSINGTTSVEAGLLHHIVTCKRYPNRPGSTLSLDGREQLSLGY